MDEKLIHGRAPWRKYESILINFKLQLLSTQLSRTINIKKLVERKCITCHLLPQQTVELKNLNKRACIWTLFFCLSARSLNFSWHSILFHRYSCCINNYLYICQTRLENYLKNGFFYKMIRKTTPWN